MGDCEGPATAVQPQGGVHRNHHGAARGQCCRPAQCGGAEQRARDPPDAGSTGDRISEGGTSARLAADRASRRGVSRGRKIALAWRSRALKPRYWAMITNYERKDACSGGQGRCTVRRRDPLGVACSDLPRLVALGDAMRAPVRVYKEVYVMMDGCVLLASRCGIWPRGG